MSDLAATNCGGGCSCNEGGCGSILWIILLLCCCGGNGCGLNSGNGCGNDSCLWIILLLFCCGGCGNGNGTDSAAANKNAHRFQNEERQMPPLIFCYSSVRSFLSHRFLCFAFSASVFLCRLAFFRDFSFRTHSHQSRIHCYLLL